MCADVVYKLNKSGGNVPDCISILSGGWTGCGVRLTSNAGTGGRDAAISVGASFSFVLLWLFAGGSFSLASGSSSSLDSWWVVKAAGGVEATTSGSIVEGRGVGSGNEGRGNSLWTI